MKFTRAEFCKYTGISQETLRYYMDRGLIAPCEVSQSGYNVFSIDQVADMMNIRQMRSLDFTVDEVGEMGKKAHSVEDILSYLEKKKRELLEQQRAFAIRAGYLDYRIDTYRKMACGQWYFKEKVKLFANEPTLAAFYDGTEEGARKVRRLSACFPYAFGAVKIPLSPESGEENMVGICLMDNCVELYPELDPSEFPSCGELRAYILKRVGNISQLTSADFSELIEFAEEHRFRIASDIIGSIECRVSGTAGREYLMLAGVVLEY